MIDLDTVARKTPEGAGPRTAHRIAALLATVVVVAGLAIGGAMFPWETRGPGADIAGLRTQMRDRAGVGARACGEVAWGADAGPALACLRSAVGDGRAAWVLVQGRSQFHPGIPSWAGFATSGKRGAWMARYDADASGGHADTARPVLWVTPCQRLDIPRDGWPVCAAP